MSKSDCRWPVSGRGRVQVLIAAWLAAVSGCAGTPRAELVRQTGGSAFLVGQIAAFDGRTGRAMSFAEVAARAGQADVVLFGEEHYDVVCNALEAQLLAALAGQRRPVALAMEFFEVDTQGPLDAYLAGRLDEDEFRKQARQQKKYITSHRPLIELCRGSSIPVLAANAPTRLTRALGRSEKTFVEFRATTQPADRSLLPRESELLEGAYRTRFEEAMADHAMPTSQPTGAPSSQAASQPAAHATSQAAPKVDRAGQMLRAYRSQSLWDDAMAESIAEYRGRNADRRVMLVVGVFHVASEGGTQVKLRRRRPDDRVVTIVYRGVSKLPALLDPKDRFAGDVVIYGMRPDEEK